MPEQIRYIAVGALFSGTFAVILATAAILASSPVREAARSAASQNTVVAQSEFFKDPDGPWPGGRIWLGTKPAIAAADREVPRMSIAIDRRTGLDI